MTKKVVNALIVGNLVFAVEMKTIQLGMEIVPSKQFKLQEKMGMIVFHLNKVFDTIMVNRKIRINSAIFLTDQDHDPNILTSTFPSLEYQQEMADLLDTSYIERKCVNHGDFSYEWTAWGNVPLQDGNDFELLENHRRLFE